MSENMLDDPEMKELLLDFCQESFGLLNELEIVLEVLEEDVSRKEELENFGQIIDRIMGAARSLSLEEISIFCELGKVIGYKAGQVNDPALQNVVVAVLFDTAYLLRKMIQKLKTGDSKVIHGLNMEAFKTRLQWLSDKFKHIERGSCKFGADEETQLSQNSIDDLMKSLGL